LPARYWAVQDADAEWLSWRLTNDISTMSCPKNGPYRYEKQMENFVISKHGHLWPKYEHYDNTKSVYNQLHEFKQLSAWLELLEARHASNRHSNIKKHQT
jgi:hypothetical protein